jgi:ABC-type multidrug transport system, ATPase and permease components
MENQSVNKRGPFSYLFEWAKPYKSRYISSVVIAVLEVIFGLIPFVCAGQMLPRLISGEPFKFTAYGVWLLIAALCWAAHFACHAVSTTVSHKATFSVIARVRTKMCDKLARMSMGKVTEKSSGEIKNIIVERVDSIEPTLAHLVPEMTSKLLAPVAILAYVFIIDWRIALISLITVPVGMILFMCMRIGYEKKFSRYVRSGKKLNSVAVEYINGIEVIKTFNQSANSYKKFTDAAYESAHSAIDWMKDTQIFFSLGMAVIPSALVTVLPAAVAFHINQTLSLSSLVMIIVLCFGMLSPVLGAMSYSDDLAKIGVIVGEINAILQEDELVRPTEKAEINGFTIKGENVKFAYKDTEILHGVSFEFKPRTVNALVGPSGGGKSTIAKLIASMWDVKSGKITIGGVDIKDIPLGQLNDMVAYVSQDNFLFDETVRENIRRGRLTATDKEVEDIAKASGCHDFIMQLENGYDTVAGSSGGHLSGGERQRLAIARAMLKDAPIVILDEATAYADPENEAVIQNAVSKLVKDKTLIVVAHRLSTITDSDQILLINGGNIEAAWTHRELLTKSSLYSGLWQAHIGAKDTLEEAGNV